ncbi:MAG TPA: peroxiredoxin [Lutibacter sp.]|nr:peroxiredoxin [Lutibacter sp.]
MKIRVIALSIVLVLLNSCSQKITKSLVVGDAVPSFSLLDQNGANFSSVEAVGKQALVIYFYPKDDTPGCTKEACKFRDEFEVFSDLNAQVIGISSDDVGSHKKFAEKYNLPFTLLADTEKEVRKLFGVPTYAGGIIPGRVTYIINKKGNIIYVFDNMKDAEKHVSKAIEILKKLENAH